jgi:hypothetical protein
VRRLPLVRAAVDGRACLDAARPVTRATRVCRLYPCVIAD